jgi:diaminopimelate epimerase
MLRFTKMEGCGNDFVVVDLRAPSSNASPSPDTPEGAVALCDRHFGVGADGVLAILPPTRDGAVARMRVWNADGSEAEMCGNGIRCVAKYLFEHDPSLRRPSLPIETGAGLLACGVSIDNNRVTHVTVAMGRPQLAPAAIPVDAPGERVVARAIDVVGAPRQFHFTAVSMGNPHAVIFVEGGDGRPADLAERFGPAIETRRELFPRRTNVEFARVHSPTEIELSVWERGAGLTLACGTGACATAVAASLEGRAQPGSEIAVALPGGTLVITVAPGYEGVLMRGPAEQVFTAELDLGALLERHHSRRAEPRRLP